MSPEMVLSTLVLSFDRLASSTYDCVLCMGRRGTGNHWNKGMGRGGLEKSSLLPIMLLQFFLIFTQ